MQDQLLHIPLDQIEVADGFNPRQSFDEDELAGLAESIGQVGVLTPITVQAKDGGGYTLIAGERRFRAAQRAGLDTIPAQVKSLNGAALAAATAENVARSDLTPLEEAVAFKRMLDGGMTVDGTVKATGRSTRYVNARLRLLDVPAVAQDAIASGKVPLSAVDELARIAEKSVPLCERIVGLLSGDVSDDDPYYQPTAKDLADDPSNVALAALSTDATNECPTCGGHGWADETAEESEPCPGCNGEGYVLDTEGARVFVGVPLSRRLGSVAWLTDEEAAAVTALQAQLPGYYAEPSIDRDEEDAAVAGGFALEWKHDRAFGEQRTVIITDRDFAADALIRTLKRKVAEHQERQAEIGERGVDGTLSEQHPVRAAKNHSVQSVKVGVPPLEGETQPEYDARVRQAGKQKQIDTRARNLELGRRLTQKLGAVPASKQKDAIKLVCGLLLNGLREPGAFVRLTRLDWQEVTPLKSGTGEKVKYPEPHEAEEAMWAWWGRAKTTEEILGRTLQLLVAVEYADQEELPQSKRSWQASRLPDGGYTKDEGQIDVDALLGKLAGKVVDGIEKPKSSSYRY